MIFRQDYPELASYCAASAEHSARSKTIYFLSLRYAGSRDCQVLNT